MKKHYYRFQTKLFLVFSILTVTTLLLILLFFYIRSLSEIEEKKFEDLRQLVFSNSQQIDGFIKEMDRMTMFVAFSPICVDIFDQKEKLNEPDNYFQLPFTNDYQTITNFLISINSTTPKVDRISIYNLTGDYISLGVLREDPIEINKHLKSQDIKSIYQNLPSVRRRRIIKLSHTDDWSNQKDYKVISLYRYVYNIHDNKPLGIVEVQQNFNKFEKYFSYPNTENISVFLYDNNNQLIYPKHIKKKDDKNIELYPKYIENFQSGYAKIKINKKKEIICYASLPFTEWNLIFVQDAAVFYKPFIVLRLAILFISLLLCMIMIIIVFFLTKKLTKPISELTNRINDVNFVNPAITIDQKGNSEILRLNNAFTQMFNKLKLFMEQEIQARFMTLQSQMNPHFLYNILSIISAESYDCGNEKIMNICNKLSTMLRYVSSFKSTQATLKDEIEHTKNYLKLMKVRYEDYLNYSINNNINLDSIVVPKLILQPLVENCFSHGFKNIEPPWNITININSKKNGFWNIEVIDNGCGISKKKRQEIENNIEKINNVSDYDLKQLEIGGLGLINIYLRLYLIYKRDIKFFIQNIKQGGFKISIGCKIIQ